MPSASRQVLAPPPGARRARLDDNGVLRGMVIRRTAAVIPVVILLAVVASQIALTLTTLRAEWALALGMSRTVRATVTGTAPAAGFARTCLTTMKVDVQWPSQGGLRRGDFLACRGSAASFPMGKTLDVSAWNGGSTVIQGETRAGAIAGVTAETVAVIAILALTVAVTRGSLRVLAAARRWRSPPWLPAEARLAPAKSGARRQPVVVFFHPDALPWQVIRAIGSLPGRLADVAADLDQRRAMDLAVRNRKDGHYLQSGDHVWVVPTGRHLRRQVRTGPYAVVRASDMRVFWGTGKPVPGAW